MIIESAVGYHPKTGGQTGLYNHLSGTLHITRAIIASCLLLGISMPVVAQTSKAQIAIAARNPFGADRLDDTSSTIGPFEFQAEIHDPDVDFNRIDFFTNAENSYKDNPRKQNIFFHVTVKETGKPVPFLLYDMGTVGGNDSHILMLQIVVPYSAEERRARITAAVESLRETGSPKLLTGPDDPTPEQFFDGYEVHEGKPGEYVLQVDYVSPSGKVSSTPLPFTIRDKGNLYEKILRSFKPGDKQ